MKGDLTRQNIKEKNLPSNFMEKKRAKQRVRSKDFAELDVHLLYVYGHDIF